MRLIVRLALSEMSRRLGHTAILATAVAVGAALVVAIQAVNGSALASLRETMNVLAGEAQLQVRAHGDRVPEDLIERVRAEPGVEHASGLVSGTIWVHGGPADGETLSVFGVDLGDDRAVRTYRVSGSDGSTAIEDPLVFLAQPDSVLLTQQFLTRFGMGVGDRMEVVGTAGPRRLTIRGALAPDGIGGLFGGSLAIMDLYAAQRLLAREGFVDQVDVVVPQPSGVDATRAQLRAVLPDTVEVVSPAQRGASTERVLRSFQAVLSGISALGLLFGAFVSYNVAGTAIAMRLRELGMLRCVGATRRQVRALVLAEIVAPGLVGSAAGIALGALLAGILCRPLAQGLSYGIRAALPVEGARVPLSAVPLALVAGAAAALLGAWGPATSAGRLQPREIGREVVTVLPITRLARLGGAALVLGAASFGVAVTRESSSLANVAILCLNGAMVLLTLAALPGMRGWMHRILARCGAYGDVAADALVRAPLRTSVTVTVIAMAVAVTLTVGSVITSFKGSVLNQVRSGVAADLIVSSSFREQAWVEAPIAESVGAEVASVPGVERIAGERIVILDQPGERITVRAIDRGFFEDPRFGRLLFRSGRPADALLAMAEGRGVIVSDNLARRDRVRLGQPLTLQALDGDVTLPVVGIVTDYASETGTVILRRETYAARWHDTLVNHVMVLAAPGVSRSGLQDAIARRFVGRLPLCVITSGDYRARFERELDGVFSFLGALRAAVVLIAVLGIADTLLGLGVARARELGVLRALGARRRGVYGLFALEALVPSGLGIVFGLVGAAGLSAVWVKFLSYQLGWQLDLHLPLGEYLELGLVAWILSVGIAVLPIGGLARRAPALLLSYE